MREFWTRVRALVTLGSEERALDEEIEFHLEMEQRKLEAEGMPAKEARRRARVRFGGVDRMKERTRDERGSRRLEDLSRDLRYAVRTLRRAPGFFAVAVITLSIGIGATTAMFTLVDTVMLRPLPYPESDRLVSVWERADDGRDLPASYANFSDWRFAASSFDALAAYVPTSATTVLTPDGGVRASVAAVTADFFAVGAVEPAVGRLIATPEHAPDGPPTAVVSDAFWRGALASAPLETLSLRIGNTLYDVVGVMPRGFGLPGRPDVWRSLDRAVPWSARGNNVVHVLGRLAEGATEGAARSEVDALQGRIHETYPEVETVGASLRSYRAEIVGDAGKGLTLLLSASGLLLLIACTNLASTLLARGAGRARELAVRASLGAGRARLVRQLFLESSVLAGVGAVGGVLTAQGILSLTRWLDPGAVPRLREVSIEPGVLVFVVALAIVTAIAFGLAPALSLTRGDVASAVRAGRSGHTRAIQGLWRAIMATEVALAFILLVGGGLVLRSLDAILDRDGGFRTDGVVTARIDIPTSKYASSAEAVDVLDRILEGARRGPGVEDAGVVLLLPVPGEGAVASPVYRADGERSERVFNYQVADGGYFAAMGIPLLAGRLFGRADGPEASHAAVIDAAMADALWPGEDPIGRIFNPRGMDPFPEHDLTVVGVVGEAVRWNSESGANPSYYVHYSQRPPFFLIFGASVVVAGSNPSAAAAHIRQVVREVDSDIPITLATLQSKIADSASDRRLNAFVLSGFALAALLLAAIGVYGVVSYSVARRTREMGIRMALGASAGSVRGTVQADALRAVAIGAVVGAGVALLATRLLESVLFDVSPADPTSFLLSGAVLTTAAWLASWLPAWRGTRLDPASVLKEE